MLRERLVPDAQRSGNIALRKSPRAYSVIASEAKQSIPPYRKHGLLRRFAPRNDG
jgi:hypothetical protein